MKLIANGLNKQFFSSFLPPSDSEIDGVVAAIAYGDDKTTLLDHCLKNHHRLDIWMRYDHTVPVSPSLLIKFLANTKNNIFCKLVPDCLHSKVIWWKGYGAYIGSANLTDRAWHTNIETGIFFTESDLYNSNLIGQLEEFFENLASLDCCVDLSEDIIDEQRQLLKSKLELEKKERQVIRKRKIPEWGGVSFIDNKKTKDKRKESFHKEWESTFSIIKNISDQINDYRPVWISEDTPEFWQTDQFLHAYYYNIVHQKDNTYPFEDYYRTNNKNPQAALMSMLSWWKDLSIPLSNEDIHLEVYAPYIRDHLSKNNIILLTEDNLYKIFSYTHATMDHVIKMSADIFGHSANTSLNKEKRAVLFTEWIMGKTNQKGMTIAELLNYVLYGGKASLMWERIYQAGKDDEYKFQHYGINSIAEVVGWARPDDTPPRNGRTNKALRALGYPVRVNI
ncbi:phosphatidylserine/phosphatidylglycerophosphate/cardiolipin synthase family protein [Salmonella enterica subsp. enterica serovar Reading]|uniref:Phosphatidylserine/phosphatidylglycerophosphate/ cardiolipin synthase family protein n=1 Tax=Salmonella enterica subsp. enterica serovar Poona TaxID=436295 RepID=A0A5Y0MKK0_SALET|nr:phospholipase D-like domain-containing protein [Salmonella enterica]EAB6494330.1 phosphatidylserine/phosphatidylglycerophosphate/cardiolipin synthase family protein [Salmonella enterica subsp. enterica]EBM7422847.1 phosphatidylserine/phosphatidylglycerophosphate/cardiolipin synthase family protein [Salmonella enterica subsp. enterica serovar Poona]EBV4609762.1 phosphatidylserine/phosphatidylglycerophosphate/cardiolipin synthase family protein [Salmonella enterica subsp. enterica serovar Solt]